MTYLPASGAPIVRTTSVPGGQRLTINIAGEDPTLESAAVATRVEADRPIVVERAQYWPNPTWHEAHNSFGVTETATRWGLAEGRVGGANGDQTYILVRHRDRLDAAHRRRALGLLERGRRDLGRRLERHGDASALTR